MNINITTCLEDKIYSLAKENKIGWAEALTFGIKFLIADKEGVDYPENNLNKKIARLSALVAELSAYKEKEAPVDPVKEAEEVLGEVAI